jgi:ABC-type iron transport system FetAB ATPase subunit
LFYFENPILEAWELLTHHQQLFIEGMSLVSLIKKPFPLLGKTINNNINYPNQVRHQAKLENDMFKPSLGVF